MNEGKGIDNDLVSLDHRDLLMPYGDLDLDQHCSGNGLLPGGIKPFSPANLALAGFPTDTVCRWKYA